MKTDNVKAVHPWKRMYANADKLKADRALAARRRELKWHKGDELKLLRQRNNYRIKAGIPLDAPLMKPG